MQLVDWTEEEETQIKMLCYKNLITNQKVVKHISWLKIREIY